MVSCQQMLGCFEYWQSQIFSGGSERRVFVDVGKTLCVANNKLSIELLSQTAALFINQEYYW